MPRKAKTKTKLPEPLVLADVETPSTHATRRRLLNDLLDAKPELVDRFLLAARTHKTGAIKKPEDAAVHLVPLLLGHETERLACLLLDARRRLVACDVLTTGTDRFTLVCPRVIGRWALTRECFGSALIMAHNHPSGDSAPSAQDIEITEVVRRAMKTLQIQLLDHIIVGASGEWCSMVDRGMVTGADSMSWYHT